MKNLGSSLFFSTVSDKEKKFLTVGAMKVQGLKNFFFFVIDAQLK
jgi:hypothetical protein